MSEPLNHQARDGSIIVAFRKPQPEALVEPPPPAFARPPRTMMKAVVPQDVLEGSP